MPETISKEQETQSVPITELRQALGFPNFMTVNQIAATGLLPKHAIRYKLKAGELPAIYIGKKALINFDRMVEQLNNL